MPLRALLGRTIQATTTGTVRGTITGPGVSDFSHIKVFVIDATDHTNSIGPAANPPVANDGTYRIDGVPAGTWLVFCGPSADLPLTAMVYKQRPGLNFKKAAAITVSAGHTTTVHFNLAAAGFLRVIVVDAATNVPIHGALAIAYLPSASVMACTPVKTDRKGSALLSNVPLQSRLQIVGPSGYTSTFWQDAATLASATIVAIPTQGGHLTLSVPLAAASS